MLRRRHEPPPHSSLGGSSPRPLEVVEVSRSVITVRTLVASAIFVLIFIGIIMALALISSIILLLLVAIVFAEGIRTSVHRVEKLHVPRPLAILIVYIVLLALLGIMITLLVQPIVAEVSALTQDFPKYQHQVTDAVTSIQNRLHISPDQGITSQISGSLNTAKDLLLAIGGYVVSIIVNFVVVLILGFLWLVTSDRLKVFVVDLFPLRQQPLASDVIREMGFRMGGYLRATAINMGVVGAATWIVCLILGLPSPILLGIFAGLTGAIPLVGPFVGMVPAILLGFTVGPIIGLPAPLVTLILLIVVQLLDANLVVPVVMNRVVALPALAVVLALLIGGAVAGIMGALLAIPLAAALQVVILRVLVPAIHHAQGRADEAFAKAATPLSPALRTTAPSGGGRRRSDP